MNYSQASVIGDVGERRVEEVLSSEAPILGYQLLNNILLVDDQTTSQLDHVLVDRFGVVVVETKNYGALIRGKSGDKFWTACYKGRRREHFLNPLRQNDRHREMLHRVLGAYGRNLPPRYVHNLVVFAGGNIEHLKLDDADKLRVVPASEVVDYLRARCWDFQPNPGDLDADQVNGLVSLIRAADQSGNADAVGAHSDNVAMATRRFGGRLRGGRRPVPAASAPKSPYGSAHAYYTSDRYPDGSQSLRPARSRWWEPAVRRGVGLMLLAALGWWVFAGGGALAIGRVVVGLAPMVPGGAATQSAPTPLPASVNLPVGYDVGLAQQRLLEADARTYRKLANASSPQLSTTGGLPTYTWQYAEKTARNAVTILKISITLDANGNIVRVTKGR